MPGTGVNSLFFVFFHEQILLDCLLSVKVLKIYLTPVLELNTHSTGC